MGERVCYREFCPYCDAPVAITADECRDCGASLPADAVETT